MQQGIKWYEQTEWYDFLKSYFLTKNNINVILPRIRLWSNTHLSSAASLISIKFDPLSEQVSYKKYLKIYITVPLFKKVWAVSITDIKAYI